MEMLVFYILLVRVDGDWLVFDSPWRVERIYNV